MKMQAQFEFREIKRRNLKVKLLVIFLITLIFAFSFFVKQKNSQVHAESKEIKERIDQAVKDRERLLMKIVAFEDAMRSFILPYDSGSLHSASAKMLVEVREIFQGSGIDVSTMNIFETKKLDETYEIRVAIRGFTDLRGLRQALFLIERSDHNLVVGRLRIRQETQSEDYQNLSFEVEISGFVFG